MIRGPGWLSPGLSKALDISSYYEFVQGTETEAGGYDT